MNFYPTFLAGSYEIGLEPLGDNRGWFSRFYCKREFAAINHTKDWVQMNHSFTEKKGTVRGMHFQKPPHDEVKLVRCIVGAVWDVIVDIRAGSPTFLKWYGAEISAQNKRMIYIPEGFAHGFQTLTDNCELIYAHTQYYQPDAESGLNFQDSVLGIEWKLPVAQISERDSNHPFISKNFKGI